MICFAIADCFFLRKRPGLDAIRQRRSFDECQHQSAGVFGVHDSVNVSDIGVIERGENFGFPLEARHAFGIAQERRGQNFERHFTLERCVACAVDLAHPALAEQGENFVVAEFVAYGKRHTPDSTKLTRSRSG